MNTIVTSKNDIIATARKLAASKGLLNISIREVAKADGISVGSIYNYFRSKSDLIIAVVEDIWKSIIFTELCDIENTNFTDTVERLFHNILASTEDYPSFFKMHVLNFADSDKFKGRKVMSEYFERIKKRLMSDLQADSNVNFDVFSDDFSQEMFVSFVLFNVVSLLSNGEKSCTTLLQIIKKSIYR